MPWYCCKSLLPNRRLIDGTHFTGIAWRVLMRTLLHLVFQHADVNLTLKFSLTVDDDALQLAKSLILSEGVRNSQAV